MTLKKLLSFSVLVLLPYATLVFGIYNGLTRHVLGANDLYSRWAGARALFLEGKNPYSLDVTRDIQMGMLGRLAAPGEDQLAFAYPLYDVFFMLPLVSLPYAQVQALWMAGLAFAAIGSVVVVSSYYRASLTPGLLIALSFGTLFFYPATRGMFLGQFALVSLLFIVLAGWWILARNDLLAGLCVAFATVKPQTAVLFVVFILGWAVWRRRWRIVLAAAVTMAALVGLAALWLPNWPAEFVRGMVAYSDYIRIGPPIQTALALFVPPEFAGPAAIILGLMLVIITAREWIRTTDDIVPAMNLTALATACTAIRIGSSDQVLLLVPWSIWLLTFWRSGHRAAALTLGIGIIVIPWLVFLSTVRGDFEDPRVTLVLPALTFIAFLAFRVARFNWNPQRGVAQ